MSQLPLPFLDLPAPLTPLQRWRYREQCVLPDLLLWWLAFYAYAEC